MEHCSQCGNELPELAPFWNNKAFCTWKCAHAAGCRAKCGPGCGCTAYAKKRRRLREHRLLMRMMHMIIGQNGLQGELDAMITRFQNVFSQSIPFCSDPELDELSDAEDPEQQLRAELADCRAELADRSAMLEAVQGALQCLQAKAKKKGASNDRVGSDHTAH